MVGLVNAPGVNLTALISGVSMIANYGTTAALSAITHPSPTFVRVEDSVFADNVNPAAVFFRLATTSLKSTAVFTRCVFYRDPGTMTPNVALLGDNEFLYNSTLFVRVGAACLTSAVGSLEDPFCSIEAAQARIAAGALNFVNVVLLGGVFEGALLELAFGSVSKPDLCAVLAVLFRSWQRATAVLAASQRHPDRGDR